jgi:methyl-accepting chemotaxis protein
MNNSPDTLLTMVAAQEDRIQRLEGNYTEILARQHQSSERIDRNTEDIRQIHVDVRELHDSDVELRESVADFTATMRGISDQFRFMSEKIQVVSDRMTERAEGIGNAVAAVAKDAKEQGDKLKALTRQEAKDEKVFDWKMKFLYGAGAAIGGSALTVVFAKIAALLGVG